MTTQQVNWMGPMHVETEFLVKEMLRPEEESDEVKPKKDSRRAVLRDAKRLLRALHSDSVAEENDESITSALADEMPPLAAPPKLRRPSKEPSVTAANRHLDDKPLSASPDREASPPTTSQVAAEPEPQQPVANEEPAQAQEPTSEVASPEDVAEASPEEY